MSTTADTGRPRDEEPSPRSGKLRGQACVHCHQRKVRCDVGQHGIPCTNCHSKGLMTCRIHQRKKPQTRGLYSNRPHAAIQPRGSAHAAKAKDSSRTRSSPRVNLHATGSVPKDPHRNHPQKSTQDDRPEQESGNLADLISGETIRTAPIHHQGRMCFIGSEPSNFNYLVRQTSSQPSHDNVFHFSNRQYHLKYTAHDIEHVPPDALERPERQLVDKLVQAYFAHINRGWPIIDEENFMEQMNGKDPRNPLSLPLFNAVLLVGAHVLSFLEDHEPMKQLQAVLFKRTKTLIDCRFEQDRLVYIQVALLLTWYSDGLEEVVANAWYWIGTAARTAIGMGMHRDTSTARLLDVQKRTWIRVWWVLFQFDTLISLSYGRPQALNLDDCDVPDLGYTNFDGIHDPESDFVIQHTRLCIIISRTLRQRWALRATTEQRIKATAWADQSLASFTSELPPHLHLSMANVGTWHSILHLTYNNFVLLLHRRPPKRQADDDVSRAATNHEVCAEASMVLVSLLELLTTTHRLFALSLFDVQAIFTAIVSINSELNTTNPLVAAKSLRKLKTISTALTVLARNWSFARGLLRIFNTKGELTLSKGGRETASDLVQYGPGTDHSSNDRPGGVLGHDVASTSTSTTMRNEGVSANQLGYSTITPSETAHNSPHSLMGDAPIPTGNILDDFVFPGSFELEEFWLGVDSDTGHI